MEILALISGLLKPVGTAIGSFNQKKIAEMAQETEQKRLEFEREKFDGFITLFLISAIILLLFITNRKTD